VFYATFAVICLYLSLFIFSYFIDCYCCSRTWLQDQWNNLCRLLQHSIQLILVEKYRFVCLTNNKKDCIDLISQAPEQRKLIF